MVATQTTLQEDIITYPFLKWAGGKRWLAASHNLLLPTSFKRYYEPFLGGAAIFYISYVDHWHHYRFQANTICQKPPRRLYARRFDNGEHEYSRSVWTL